MPIISAWLKTQKLHRKTLRLKKTKKVGGTNKIKKHEE